jgi:hypothetical protein
MTAKAYVEAQDCRNCKKRDEHGGCTKPGLCIYVDKLADGETRMRENTIDPQIAERIGERGYLNLVDRMDIARRKKIFDKNPKMKDIITMLVAKVPWKDIEAALHVSRTTVTKANKLWHEMQEDNKKGSD